VVNKIIRNVYSSKQLPNPVEVDEAVWNENSGKQFLNSAVVNGIERNVDLQKQLINPVVVDEVVRDVNSREQFLNPEGLMQLCGMWMRENSL
jgi:hypothetical protein